jgi:hypothetical protein
MAGGRGLRNRFHLTPWGGHEAAGSGIRHPRRCLVADVAPGSEFLGGFIRLACLRARHLLIYGSRRSRSGLGRTMDRHMKSEGDPRIKDAAFCCSPALWPVEILEQDKTLSETRGSLGRDRGQPDQPASHLALLKACILSNCCSVRCLAEGDALDSAAQRCWSCFSTEPNHLINPNACLPDPAAGRISVSLASDTQILRWKARPRLRLRYGFARSE